MQLQLAENMFSILKPGHKAKKSSPLKPFIFIPNSADGSRGTYIRRDHLDVMPDKQYNALMNKIARHQREVINGLMSEEEYTLSSKQGRINRRIRKEKKQDSKSRAREARAAAKGTRAARQKGGGGKQALDTATDIATKLLGPKGGPAPDTTPTPWYKTTPGVIGLVAGGLLLVGGIGYAVTKKKK